MAPKKGGHSREASIRRLFGDYVYACKRKNVYWGLTLEEFQTLTSSPCIYCGRSPAQKSRAYTFNGIDRLNPRQGYLPKNCVTACKECNFIKGTRLTYDEMLVVGQALVKFRKKSSR